MSAGGLWSRLARAQQGRVFKIIASVVVVALAIAAWSTSAVRSAMPAESDVAQRTQEPVPADPAAAEAQRRTRESVEAMERIAREVISARASPASVAVAAGVVSAVALVVIWLGLALTYLALGLVAGLVAWPLWLAGWRGVATLLMGAAVLTAGLTALMQLLRLAYSGSTPVLAVARNVVAEAARMRLSVLLIVLLIFAMAGLPLLLDPDMTPQLRYRVQSFLQWGTGGSYALIAVLTVLFSVATVSFEQRDKQIWQTMTKPVPAWGYLLGKWLGVVGVNAVLLAVCLSGVYLFTEYLRRQPADGETRRDAAITASAPAQLTPDRLIVETQVLTARRVVEPVDQARRDDPEFLRGVAVYLENARAVNPQFAQGAAAEQRIADELFTGYRLSMRSVPPGGNRTFRFEGLGEARERGLPLTMRYKVNAMGNRGDATFRVTFFFQGQLLAEREIGLGTAERLTIPVPNLINPDGSAEILVVNGSLRQQGSQVVVVPNPESMVFDADGGLELSYQAGSFGMNLLRVGVVLWVKLAFLAMLGVWAATFLSFPVACIVALSCFLMAEGAGFLATSLEYYDATDPITKEIAYWKIPVRALGLLVAWTFGTYAELAPTQRLVDGKLLSWGLVGHGTVVLAAWTAGLFGLAVAIFRRRELAMYSGH